MNVYMHICKYVYIYICKYVILRISKKYGYSNACLFRYVFRYAHSYVDVDEHTYEYLPIYIPIYIYVYAFIFMIIHAYRQVYMHRVSLLCGCSLRYNMCTVKSEGIFLNVQ
jgi:hypothetical protein